MKADWLEVPRKSRLVTAAKVCASVALGAVMIYGSYMLFIMMFILTLVTEWSVQLGTDAFFETFLLMLANCLTLAASVLIMTGTLVYRRSLIPYAVGWLCLSAEMLFGSILLPLANGARSPAVDVSVGEWALYLAANILLTLLPALIGVLFIGVQRLCPVKKWMLVSSASLCAALYIFTVVVSGRSGMGMMGVPAHFPGLFLIICSLAMILPMLASAVLMALSLKDPQA